MPNLPKNIEKILLGVAGVAAVGLAAVGFMKFNGVDNDFNTSTTGTGGKDTSIPEAVKVTAALASLKADRKVEQGMEGTRPVDLFVGIQLFADKNNPNKPVDPVGGPPVHPPIPNSWWLENQVDMTYANSPDRDEDGDGFTNREEYDAQTNPKDPKSVPSLIKKLAYVRDESIKWYVLYNLDTDGKWAPRLTYVGPDGKLQENRVSMMNMLKPGDVFFAEGSLMGQRFKFTGFTQKEVESQRTHTKQMVKVGLFEDLSENKKGDKYESQASLPKAEIEANAYYDRKAVLELRAIGNAGKEFKIQERTAFALPPDAPTKNYFLKKVTPDGIEVEVTKEDGSKETVAISKGN